MIIRTRLHIIPQAARTTAASQTVAKEGDERLTHPYMHETSMTTSIMSQHSSYESMSTGELQEER